MLDSEMNALPWGTFRPRLPRARTHRALAQYPVGAWQAAQAVGAAVLPAARGSGRFLAVGGTGSVSFPITNVCERKALLRPDRMDRNEYAFLRTPAARARSVFADVGANAGLYSSTQR